MSFEDFLVNKQKEKETGSFDATKTIERYKTLVGRFYQIITDEWINAYIAKGLISYGKEAVSITEELLGTYSVDALWLQFGGERLSITPVGTHMIGTDARFDLIGKEGREVMVVHDKTSDNWLWVDYTSKRTKKPLNAKAFQELVMELMN